MIREMEVEAESRRLKKDLLGGKFARNAIQGACRDGRRYYVGFSCPDDQAAVVRMADLSFTDGAVEKIAEGLPIGHCNDMEFVRETGEIYVAGGSSVIPVLDAEALTVKRTIRIGMDAWGISRYPDGCWFIHDGNTARKYRPDFSGGTVLSRNDRKRIAEILGIPEDGGCWQGSVMIGEVPYRIYTQFGDQKGSWAGTSLVSFYSGEEARIYRSGFAEETESAVQDADGLKFIYGNTYIGSAVSDVGQVKNIFGTVTAKVKTGSQVVNVPFVPDGYALIGAEVQAEIGGKVFLLPLIENNEKCLLRAVRVTDSAITLRSSKNYGTIRLQIVGQITEKN